MKSPSLLPLALDDPIFVSGHQTFHCIDKPFLEILWVLRFSFQIVITLPADLVNNHIIILIGCAGVSVVKPGSQLLNCCRINELIPQEESPVTCPIMPSTKLTIGQDEFDGVHH